MLPYIRFMQEGVNTRLWEIWYTHIKTWWLRCYRPCGYEEEWGVRGSLTIQVLGNCGTTSDFRFLWGSRLQKYHSRVGIAITCVIPPPSHWRWFRSCPDSCFVQNQLEPRICRILVLFSLINHTRTNDDLRHTMDVWPLAITGLYNVHFAAKVRHSEI